MWNIEDMKPIHIYALFNNETKTVPIPRFFSLSLVDWPTGIKCDLHGTKISWNKYTV